MKGNVRKKILIVVLTIIFSLILFSLTLQSNAAEEVTEVDSWDVSNDDGTSNVTATLYSDGSFVISGTGAMKDYLSSSNIPYNDKKSVIKTVKIESGVTSIGSSAFEYCTNLTSISVDENNKNYSSENGVLFNKDKTKIKRYPEGKVETEYIIPNTVTIIGISAFSGCSSLTSIEIPEGVTSIGFSAFYICRSLTSIEIPNSVTGIGNYAFEHCESLTSINVANNNENYSSENGILFNKDKTKIISYPVGKKETEYKIPEGVTSIGDDAFAHCESLTSIDISNSVTSIGSWAFKGCSSLISIEIPKGVTSIGSGEFAHCKSLTSIAIPEGVTSIEYFAFCGCRSLTSIEIPNSVTSIGEEAFYNCESLTNIKIPNSVTSIGDNAFSGAKLTVVVASGTENVQELELPNIIQRVMNEEDILYTENNFTLANCNLSEDKTKLLVDTEVASTKEASLKITEGALNGLTVVVAVPSGTITYSTTEWINKDVIATVHLVNGETIKNNDGKNTYTFTENGAFTFKYVTGEGEEKEATATVENIEELTIKTYKETQENGSKYIENIKPGENIQEVLNNIETNGTVEVYNETEKMTDKSGQVLTGMTIKIAWGTVDEEAYTIVVTGDLNGDGQMGNSDLLRMARYKAKLDNNLTGAYLKAADIYKDGKYADNKDLLKIARVLAKLENL